MRTFFTQDGIEFIAFLATNYPELHSKFPQGFHYTIDKYDILVPEGILTEKEQELFKNVLQSWLKQNAIL